VADTLHGTVLIDPYRWLEDGESEPVKRWSDSQNARGARADDQPDPQPEARAIVRPDGVVDRPPGEARDRECERLGGKCQDDRPREQPPMRRGETEQAAERTRGCRCRAQAA